MSNGSDPHMEPGMSPTLGPTAPPLKANWGFLHPYLSSRKKQRLDRALETGGYTFMSSVLGSPREVSCFPSVLRKLRPKKVNTEEFKDIEDARKLQQESRALNPFGKKPIFKPVQNLIAHFTLALGSGKEKIPVSTSGYGSGNTAGISSCSTGELLSNGKLDTSVG